MSRDYTFRTQERLTIPSQKMFRNYKTWSRANSLPSRVFGKEKDSWKMEDNYLQDAFDEVFSIIYCLASGAASGRFTF